MSDFILYKLVNSSRYEIYVGIEENENELIPKHIVGYFYSTCNWNFKKKKG
jgi:hypothetical protein